MHPHGTCRTYLSTYLIASLRAHLSRFSTAPSAVYIPIIHSPCPPDPVETKVPESRSLAHNHRTRFADRQLSTFRMPSDDYPLPPGRFICPRPTAALFSPSSCMPHARTRPCLAYYNRFCKAVIYAPLAYLVTVVILTCRCCASPRIASHQVTTFDCRIQPVLFYLVRLASRFFQLRQYFLVYSIFSIFIV